MEVYLNVIETGDGIYGTEAASNVYYHKAASKLTIREAASIAAILPDPRRWSPVQPSLRVARKTQRIIKFMGKIKTEIF
jgi:monofunctional biosynthetic peptidoglycan transglycosylase